jgi:hydrogenase expression/formation protein HypD
MGRSERESRELLAKLHAWQGPRLTFMEVCGTHTMAAARSGLRQLLPPNVRLISGPGCPVCVTPVGYVDHALALARQPAITICTFGDLVRVPGSAPSHTAGQDPPSLGRARAAGADVRVVFSPLDALALARARPEREVVFLGVGFETTAPTLGAAVMRAADEGLANFSMLVAAKTIPETLEQLASSAELRLSGLLCPGHVSVVLGSEIYRPLAERHKLPCAIAGFEPVEILRGLASLVEQVSAGVARVDCCYAPVRPQGNLKARAVLERAFVLVDSAWRGLGVIPRSGLALRPELRAHDAAARFAVELPEPVEPRGCRCGDVLRGVLDPVDCPLFGKLCTPECPQGACMVSSEGSCAARYQYRDEG